MNKKIFIAVFLVTCIFPFKVNALKCDYNEQARLRKIASNVVASYTYEENNNDVKFKIILTNINSDLYVYESNTKQRYDYNGTGEITLSNYSAGSKVRFLIYTTKEKCVDSYLNSIYVNLPDYNKFYNDPLCAGKENLNICYKWQPISYSYDEFAKKIKEYSNNSNENEKKADTSKEKTIFDYIFEVFYKYYIYIIIIVSLIIIIIIVIKGKKNQTFDL